MSTINLNHLTKFRFEQDINKIPEVIVDTRKKLIKKMINELLKNGHCSIGVEGDVTLFVATDRGLKSYHNPKVAYDENGKITAVIDNAY